MCGIAGFIARRTGADGLRSILERMTDTIEHRGPDDRGDWFDECAGVAIGFRRLAIIDLSPAGHQPMTSPSGRYIAAYNGEVYNFERLRRELESAGHAPRYRGHSDTEVVLAAADAYGVRGAVDRLIGMFAIALWDREERRLHLIRDRMGVKPMYYGFAGGSFVFGSEIGALAQFPDFDATIDPHALAMYFRYGYVPTPLSIYRSVRKQPPGTILTISEEGTPVLETYWSPREAANRGIREPFRGTEAEAEQQLDTLLRDAVGLRMIADVPLGAFLSGGIDSSLVTALMQAQSSKPVKTFSIGFAEAGFDEAPYAKQVAQHLGTEHTEHYVTSADGLNVIPHLPAMFGEPFADSSQIPTHLVSAMARRHVTVALSGDGGDELFGGYNRYFIGQRLLRTLGWMPRPVQRALYRTLIAVSPAKWDTLAAVGAPYLRFLRYQRIGEGVHKVARVLESGRLQDLYFQLVWQWRGIAVAPEEPPEPLADRSSWPALENPVELMMYLDQVSYLPDDILVKVDRVSMAVSLECREPLLDHRLVEFAWSLPLSMKIRNGTGKVLLRKVLSRYVPDRLIDRPKAGFALPVGEWLRGPLREWAEVLLDERRLRDAGLIDPAKVRAVWAEHLSGSRDWQHHLWTVLMFEAWHDMVRTQAKERCDSAVEHASAGAGEIR